MAPKFVSRLLLLSDAKGRNIYEGLKTIEPLG